MRKVWRSIAALILLTLALSAGAQLLPKQASFRYSEQLSNGPAGTCGCFTLQGAALDGYWKMLSGGPDVQLGLVVDAGVENTGNVNGQGYGLTVSTYTAGPRLLFSAGKFHPFAQVLFGLAHGSGSQFPQSNNTLTPSANSFAFDLGGGFDYALRKRLSVRFLQVDYLRTSLPNNTTNWQNNLRLSGGLTVHFSL